MFAKLIWTGIVLTVFLLCQGQSCSAPVNITVEGGSATSTAEGGNVTNTNTSENTNTGENTNTNENNTQTDVCPNDPNKTSPGICGCGIPDTDTDRDGTPDCVDGCPNDPNKTVPGLCGCGKSEVPGCGENENNVEGWTLIYSHDFSTDPNWTTNNPSHYKWDSANNTFAIHNLNGSEEYAVTTIPYDPNKSYKLVYDIRVSRCDWAAGINVGLWDADKANNLPASWYVRNARIDQGSSPQLLFWDSNGNGNGPNARQPAPFDLNIWYRNEIVYDHPNAQMTLTVTRVSDGSLVGVDNSYVPAERFLGIQFVGISQLDDSYASGATAIGEIDNLALYVR